MRKKIVIISFLFIVCSFLSSCSFFKSIFGRAPQLEKIEVNKAFQDVYQAVQAALKKKSTLKLDGIDLAFQTVVTNETTVGAKVWVLSGAYTRGMSRSKTATFSFGRDTKEALISPKVDKDFTNYLVGLLEQSENIQSINEFGLTDLEVEVEFTLTKSLQGGVEELDIIPVSPTLTHSRERAITHTVTIKFKK